MKRDRSVPRELDRARHAHRPRSRPGRARHERPAGAWPRPAATRVLTVANQKGGVGKTTSDGQPRGRAGPARPAGAGHRPRPAGQRQHGARASTPVGTPSIYDVLLGGRPLAEVAAPVELRPNSALRAGDPRPRRRRHRADLAGGSRVPAAAGGHGLPRAGTDRSTTCSSTARRRSGLLTLNALVAGREVLIPIQCEYYALEGLAQLLNTVELVRSHLNPELAVTHRAADDVRQPDPAGRPGGGRGAQALRRAGADAGDPAQRPGVRGARVRPDRDDLRRRLARRGRIPAGGARDRATRGAHAGVRRRERPSEERTQHERTSRRGGLGRGWAR